MKQEAPVADQELRYDHVDELRSERDEDHRGERRTVPHGAYPAHGCIKNHQDEP
jgi:hypothetical protein